MNIVNKKSLLCMCIVLFSISLSAQKKASKKTNAKTAVESFSLKNEVDSLCYYLGYNLGTQIAFSDIEDINIETMSTGIQEAFKNGKNTDEVKMKELQTFLNEYFSKLQTRINEKYLKEGQDFLEANSKKPGVVSVASGLQYKIIKEGNGVKPTKNDKVDVIYHGTLIDGTVFDSSKDRGDTATFPVNGVVAGFSEALTLMNEGSVWEVYIPSELGYGANPRPGGAIKPNNVLIFEITLVKIQ
jgi:FKBP-type peptidyl-prolyl cis-trans isomerase